ncbi:MAG: phosphomannomutase [Deltaproteobacteria bacterium]
MSMDNQFPSLPCFKAYDVRGRVPDQLDEKLARRIGMAFAAHFTPKTVAVGHDIRLSSPALCRALAEGFSEAGVDVLHLGQCGTEEIYFVKEMERLAAQGPFTPKSKSGTLTTIDNRPAYIQHLLGYVARDKLKPLRLVVNAGNGCAGAIIDQLEKELPFSFIKLLHEPDGSFPNGVPNPLLPENRAITAKAVRETGADLGIAWDGDFDRCFFFDESGAFIEGYYIVGLLSQAILAGHPGEKIIHDPRLVWNTREIVRKAGGIPVMSKTGHAFIKERMRRENAIYGGEMSAHHYVRDFSYCESGMIPWLLITDLRSPSARPLSSMVREAMAAYPVSGEINSRVADPDAVIAAIEEKYRNQGEYDYTDGLSCATPSYRFNIRKSNTEPVLRLNVETRGDRALMEKVRDDLLSMIQP